MADERFELPPADVLAYQLSEAAADRFGDDAAQEYLFAFVHEILMLEPGVREHLAREVLADLKEAVTRVEDSRHSHATVRLIEDIERHWRSDD